MKHAALFNGIGGFQLAAAWIGWENVMSCEINEFCNEVTKYYWPKCNQHKDVRTTDFKFYRGKIGVLTGGFPCQPFSQAGERIGEQDDRYLFEEMLRAIHEIEPGWIVAENVYGITSPKFKKTFNTICASLENEGYKIQPYIIPATAVAAEHERYRVWFVAYSDEKFRRLSIQSPINGIATERKQQKEKWGSHWEKSELASYSRESFDKWANRPTTPKFYDGVSIGLDIETFYKESNNAFGNSIVPQVAYEIFKTIEHYESDLYK